MTPNWFIGLPVEAGEWFDRLVPAVAPGFTRFHPGDLHLTVAFFGPVSEEAARAGWAALDWPLGPVRATLGAVVPMGNPQRYSALSALLVGGRADVEAAIGACRDVACEAAGAPREKREPKAHLTLARPGRSATVRTRDEGLVWARGLALGEVALELDRVALYTWAADRSERMFRLVDEQRLAR